MSNLMSFTSFGLSSGSGNDDCAGLVGQTIDGRYTLESKIGEGGFGCVFLARQKSPNRQVAVKVQKRAGLDSHRMAKEADLLARLDDRGIARVFEAGDWASPTGPRIFVAMELIPDGVPLHRFCTERRLPVTERLDLFREVCRAVSVAHQEGIIHRDLKPGNILVDRRGQPRVIDFGISKLVSAEPDPASGDSTGSSGTRADETRAGAFLGTPTYAAPEQQHGRATPQSDVHALGMMLKNDLFADLKGGTPTRLAAIVARCTASDPRLRPRDAAQLVAELDRDIRTHSRRRWLPLQVAAGAAVLLASGFVVRLFATPSAGSQAPQTTASAGAHPEHGPLAVTFQESRTAAGDPTSKRLATTIGDKLALSVSGTATTIERRLQVAPAGALRIVFGDAGSLVATSDVTGWRVWDLQTIEADSSPIFEAYTHASSSAHDGLLAVSPDGSTLFAQDGPRSLITYAPRSAARLGTASIEANDPATRMTSLAATAIGDAAVVGLSDGSVRRWAVTTGKTDRFGPDHGPGPVLLAATVDGSRVASCGGDGKVIVHDGGNGKVLHASVPVPGTLTAICCGAPGDVLVATRLPRGSGAAVMRLSYRDTGQLVVTGSTAIVRSATALAYTGCDVVVVGPDIEERLTGDQPPSEAVAGVTSVTAAARDPAPR